MCSKIISKGDYYVKGGDLKFPDLAHMECAKNEGWKKSRAVAPVSNADQQIKVTKKLSPKWSEILGDGELRLVGTAVQIK